MIVLILELYIILMVFVMSFGQELKELKNFHDLL